MTTDHIESTGILHAGGTVTTGPLKTKITRTVTIDYDWDHAPLATKHRPGPDAKITHIRLEFYWDADLWKWVESEWTTGASGARVKKDGAAYDERTNLSIPRDLRLALIAEHTPTTQIELDEVTR